MGGREEREGVLVQPHGAALTAAASRLSQIGCWLPLTRGVRMRRRRHRPARPPAQESRLGLISCLFLGVLRIIRINDISRFMLGTSIEAAAAHQCWGVSGGGGLGAIWRLYSNIRPQYPGML